MMAVLIVNFNAINHANIAMKEYAFRVQQGGINSIINAPQFAEMEYLLLRQSSAMMEIVMIGMGALRTVNKKMAMHA